MAIAGYVRGMEYAHTLIVTIDGVKVFQNTIGGEEDIRAIDQQQAPAVAAINGRFMDIPVKVTAGPHKVARDVRRADVRGIGRRAASVPAGRGRGAHSEDREPGDPGPVQSDRA